ncbi:MAG: Uma2 family endonuclease [Rubrivivax sp.]|nr:Uma2 family endonuclease [Pyrinomonadaceae bacterium]
MAKLLDEVQLPEHKPHESAAILLDLRPVINLTDDQFYELCRANGDLRFERTAEGEILIMPPTGTRTGNRNSRLTQRLANWTDGDGTGIAFDSSTAFKLPNGAVRSPDASWIRRERYDALTPEEQEKFSPICPDFVVELRSRTDGLAELQAKMEEYILGGAQLGWLIDPQEKRIYVYRPQAQVETLENPDSVAGDPVLKGFVLDLQEIW